MTTVREGSKSEQAYTWLRERISSHRYGPGYRLVLGAIAEDLGMSVVPVREAIRRLEAEGLVTYERNVGAHVSLVDEGEYAHTMQTLGLVEGAATALSAPLLDEGALERAEEINERMLRLLDHFDAHRFTELNRDFHSVLYEPCPNPHILDLVHRGWGRLSGIRDTTFAFVPGRARHSVEEHAHILELIRSGADALTIELAARDHRWRTMDAFLASRHPDREEEGR
ncbi:GntR family transcriptional regulator [Microbacterium esteraromaticum]|uniref:GntR family transcriptional regulator n=1 Tax=Microbacterium esteraromaticum TaxID=57043 RepID=A0A939DUY8_9MICO|nr:GntR family transcriptional regulator [Microbacterium esteraromaticum]MBN7793238.1 GntR family transcriptional regulator [Microbacterium esteraromaticum]MBN8205482.1 GntR family transcriptional regulator [Microbacterium esteraromaticum]MBN8415636.1 GntR family transcriptional regulator [Microbacterium esteraromaticum]MBN8424018.1 GntR family transcriptional regulator [Microbacterium esteraromaticum]MBY6060444.1 GntR family transcriptional regulator [Microbacterium esteraromaticum]